MSGNLPNIFFVDAGVSRKSDDISDETGLDPDLEDKDEEEEEEEAEEDEAEEDEEDEEEEEEEDVLQKLKKQIKILQQSLENESAKVSTLQKALQEEKQQTTKSLQALQQCEDNKRENLQQSLQKEREDLQWSEKLKWEGAELIFKRRLEAELAKMKAQFELDRQSLLVELNKLRKHAGNAEAQADLAAQCEVLKKDNLSFQGTIAQLRQPELKLRLNLI